MDTRSEVNLIKRINGKRETKIEAAYDIKYKNENPQCWVPQCVLAGHPGCLS